MGKSNDTIRGRLGYLAGQMEAIAERLARLELLGEATRRDVADLRAELPQNYVSRGDCHERHARLESTIVKELDRKVETAPLRFGWQVAAVIGGGLMGAAGLATAIWKMLS